MPIFNVLEKPVISSNQIHRPKAVFVDRSFLIDLGIYPTLSRNAEVENDVLSLLIAYKKGKLYRTLEGVNGSAHNPCEVS